MRVSGETTTAVFPILFACNAAESAAGELPYITISPAVSAAETEKAARQARDKAEAARKCFITNPSLNYFSASTATEATLSRIAARIELNASVPEGVLFQSMNIC